MRALLTFGSLLLVLAVIGVSVRSQLHADKRFLPAAASDAASAAPGIGQPAVAQYQRELEKAMRDDAQQTADRAASAGEDGTR